MILPEHGWGGLAVRTLYLMSTRPPLASRADAATYTANAAAAISALQQHWYDARTGIWDNAWWNSANALTTLADFASIDIAAANQLNVGGILQNTFANAQRMQVQALKVMTSGLVQSKYAIQRRRDLTYLDSDIKAAGAPGFLNDYYDDEGWWALGLIRAWDVSRNQAYLDAAVAIYQDMKTGQGGPCAGGIYWNKDRAYVNAIANELFLAVAASLANRIPGNAEFLGQARGQWAWFRASGMINAQGTINDGLDAQCRNNGGNTWSYNQGVVLGGLVELSRATGDAGLLDQADAIAHAAIGALSDRDGVLHDSCEPNCGADGNQFKGVFVRNLRYLHQARPQQFYKDFITKNADVIWANDRAANNTLGVVWSGPYAVASGPTQSSALDALVAAMGVNT